MTAGELDSLPEGWAQAVLSDVFRLNPPRPKAAEHADGTQVTFVPMPAVDAVSGTIAKPTVRSISEVRKGFTAFRDGDVILAKITPCMENGKAAVARGLTNGLGFGSTEFHVFRSAGAVLPDYLFHFIRQESFRRAAEHEMTGSVGQKRVPAEFLQGIELPVPPLAEQHRIVTMVEAVLGRASSALERLEQMPTTMRRFRQAVLAAACSGRLTADWRESRPTDPAPVVPAFDADTVNEELPELPELPDNWRVTNVAACSELVQYGTSDKADPAGTVPLLRMGNIQKGMVVFDDLKMVSETLPGLDGLLLQRGDLLFNRTNSPELVGKSAVYDRDDRATFASYLIRARCKAKVLDSRVLCWWLNSAWGRAWAAKVRTDGVSQSNINGTKLQQMPVPVSPLPEQAEIVRRVSALFSLADTFELRSASALKQAETLTQAVLAKAFRGELVPTEAEIARQENRSYETADELLARDRTTTTDKPKQIRAQKSSRRRPKLDGDALNLVEG